MPNHYTNVLFVFPGFRGEDDEPDLIYRIALTGWGDRPFHRVVPMPAELEGTHSVYPPPPSNQSLIAKYGADNWYDWEIANRGCKWDAYNVQVPAQLPGDSMAVQITFCSAWSPPNERVRDLLAQELLDRYGASRVVWLGIEPYDRSFRPLGEWAWEPGVRGLIEVTP